MATINFDINDALKDYMSDPTSIPTPEADGTLVEFETEPESLTNQVLNPVINPIVDAVADSPDAIMRAANMDSLQFLLKSVLLFEADAFRAPLVHCKAGPYQLTTF